MNSPDARLYSKLLVEESKKRDESYLKFLHSQLTHGDQTDPYWLALREINEAA